MDDLLAPVRQFLHCETPDAWVEMARDPAQLPTLLIDHANCENKAALTAHSLVRRYCLPKGKRHLLPKLAFYRELDAIPEKAEILGKRTMGESDRSVFAELERNPLLFPMVRLIQEELHHFEQVLEIMAARGIPYGPVSASRYARSLLKHVRTYEPAAVVDKMIIGAYIEARSCERFAKIAPHLDEELGRFYVSLLRSEARHYQDYLALASHFAGEDISERVAFFGAIEAELIYSPDPQFRFHSGPPVRSDSC
ncbi:tRNA-(ms[2]io[6]A)-hydroxylase [Aeromonas sp. sif2416]|uniref:tRNA isopentenyl-2-thiomethyl-A-37 hydroxylase MiaE n=1 Tax=Aeromonas sp. sif2416 TaxID=2854793 RepID=UPI001C47D66B|nr:tRNA isopentenyl-2-thiomethyl-A-37 hydroxylase MiaE [Aeromonas sp. sif2416]MBV7438879.1 tRNA isopentenyl-2-thiomethyl-A-37 hydroxylase MiaE [Aeromonas sp. sif2416]